MNSTSDDPHVVLQRLQHDFGGGVTRLHYRPFKARNGEQALLSQRVPGHAAVIIEMIVAQVGKDGSTQPQATDAILT